MQSIQVKYGKCKITLCKNEQTFGETRELANRINKDNTQLIWQETFEIQFSKR